MDSMAGNLGWVTKTRSSFDAFTRTHGPNNKGGECQNSMP